MYRGSLISVNDLKDNSNVKVVVECPHGQRVVRWSRRHQLCRNCASEQGLYSTSKPGRKITWGDKISEAKKGKKATEEHKKALVEARKEKLAKRLGKSAENVEFPTRSPQYKIRLFMMRALKKSPLNSSLAQQDDLFKKYLNYSVEDLKAHIESQFEPGMTWDNYGEWEIDHIKPDSWFKYDSFEDEGFKQSWALSNLQPMWASQNRRKSNIYSGKFKEKIIYFLCGQSGVGKTTVANKLVDYFTIIDRDNFKNIKDLDKEIANNWFNDKPILLQIGVHISTTIKRYEKKGYKVIPFFIIEDPAVVMERIRSRGGSRISNVIARGKRIRSLAHSLNAYCNNADAMVQYLIDYGKKAARN
jgi:hypothetical protein